MTEASGLARIDETAVFRDLRASARHDAVRVRELPAKSREMRGLRGPNALATFQEFLEDYGSEATRREGEGCMARSLGELGPALRAKSEKMVRMLKGGRCDVYC
jgi:hypothetical protein